MSKELTFKDVAPHNTKRDLYVVIHDKVYDASKFVDEHPYVVPQFPEWKTQREQVENANAATTTTEAAKKSSWTSAARMPQRPLRM